MADYATLADFHAYLNVDISDTTNDTAMSMAISAASSAIERTTNRQFAPQDTVATTRYFTAVRQHGEEAFLMPSMTWAYWYPFQGDWSWFWVAPDRKVIIDDIFLTNQLITDIVVTDFTNSTVIALDRLFPFNNAAKGKPFEQIWFQPQVNLPRGEGNVAVTAKFGWPTIPATIKNACLLQASRYFVRRLSPNGLTAGVDQLGNSMRFLAGLDRDVESLVADYRRWWAAA